MTWFLLSFLTALAVASQDAWVKRWFSCFNEYEMFVFPLLYALPLTTVTIVFIPAPPLDTVFFWSFIVSLPLNAVPFILYMKAIRISPLSLTVPYLSFTPVFMIATGFVFLGEIPDQWGVFGILAVCAGSYVLHIDMGRHSLFAPFKIMFREKGSGIMLLVAFIFSFSSVIGKVAIMHSSVMFFQMSFFAVLSVLMAGVFSISGHVRLNRALDFPGRGVVAGILLFAHILFHGFAISMTKAVYMISIKRLSIVFGVIYGGLVFNEENIPVRLAGTLIMFFGAALILLKAG
jgi:drug/metabolite transporter (DMT)-like permease